MDAWRARLGKAVRFFFRMMTKTMRRTWGWRLTLLTWLCLNGVLLVVCVKGREQTLRGLGNYGQTHAPRLFCQGPNLGSQFLWGMLSHEEVIISHKFGKGLCTRQTFFLGGGVEMDVCGLVGLFSRQQILDALWMLALGICTYAMDDYCRTSESTTMECMKWFCVAVRSEFGEYHFRQPTQEDFHQHLAINSARGFPDMFAFLDCMHYE
jgi:hypothetical protein